ncbi:hypothetical protein [Rhodoferax ferrireducens]|uniref:hypothetical protein n=1 Tax=Rhodoferax ferrireducens TaxID=192843 RepID=UPI000E0DFFFA|nr:hypothetical protein [Rhodoferax ferrireducens]
MKHAWWIVALAASLLACGERPQTLGPVKQDAAPSSGTGKPFADGGWKQGDKASWESHMKARTQQGQNDYSRMN